MREIKFRYVFQHDETGRIVIKNYSLDEIQSEEFNLVWAVRYGLVSRDLFTGLKDKNGKEIYEGDVLRQAKNLGMSKVTVLGIVKFDMGKFYIDWEPEKNNIDRHYSETLQYHNLQSEIVGNVYENIEILNSTP